MRGSDVIGAVVDVDVEVVEVEEEVDEVVDDVVDVVDDVVDDGVDDVVDDVVVVDVVVDVVVQVWQQSEMLTREEQAKEKHPDCRSPYKQSGNAIIYFVYVYLCLTSVYTTINTSFYKTT